MVRAFAPARLAGMDMAAQPEISLPEASAVLEAAFMVAASAAEGFMAEAAATVVGDGAN